MKDSLKNSIRKKFEGEQLSDQQLDCLMQTQNKLLHQQETATKPFIRYASFLSLAAVVVFSCFLFFNNLEIRKDMPFAIASEVAHNHYKLKPLEVESSALNEVSQYFTKLDFKPVSSVVLDHQQLTLLGARYCSLQGITAAQIRYKTQDGKLVTFYEVPYDKNTYSTFPMISKGEDPVVSYANGIGVKMWVEKGLLMAVTL